MIVEDYAARLDDEGRRMFGVIRNETQRMSHLIDDLLAFSRIGRQPVAPETIDMQAMAQEVFDELAAMAPDRKLKLELRPLPPAIGTPSMIRQAWINLLNNAIKFTRERDPGVIEVGAQEGADGVPIYYVKDNGVGFDMRHAEKLFGVFERLHSDAGYEGTGVGLSLVKRIVQRHGGRIWADAEVDRGATFYFTLSKAREGPACAPLPSPT
jgi:two-component system sensor kinase